MSRTEAAQEQVAPPATAEIADLEQAGWPAGEQLSLLEMGRIMDVAATLRKERSIVQQQLNLEQTKAKLRERLLEAARIAGDPVTEREVDAAIEQYYDRLHEFRQPKKSWRTLLAHLWVRRGPILAGLVALAALAATLWGLLAAGLLPGEARDVKVAARQAAAVDQAYREFEAAIASIRQLSDDPEVAGEAKALASSALIAKNEADQNKLDDLLTEASQLQATLESSYRLVIPSGSDEQSGFQRDWTDENGTRTSGFYLVVEARDLQGRAVEAPVRNRETDRVQRVSRWAEQVPEDVFNRLLADKTEDGVLDERLFGEKVRGRRELDVLIEGPDDKPLPRMGQITSWQ